MKSIKLSLVLFFIFGYTFSQQLIVSDLTCEHKSDPLGIDVIQPRLSWKIKNAGKNMLQTAYSVRVSTDPRFRASKIVWQTGKVAGGE